ncbi:DNA-binding response regulator [Clostridia bacterium]|nr:DNA-binding response regulator [Clostridia bacterium]
MKVLYVEDEKNMARAVAQVLKKNNYSVDLAHDGEDGLDLAASGVYDVVILDIMLPKLDGISILREMRNQNVTTPVILLTAKGETEDKIVGLDSGADDYLAKPFQTDELMARLRALGRRKELIVTNNVLVFGDIELNYNALDLFGNGQTFHLTLKESQLLELLIINKKQAISTETIIEKVWGWDSDAEDSHVQVQVAFLRKKLSLLSKLVKIKTVRGIGYMLELDEEGGDGDV